MNAKKMTGNKTSNYLMSCQEDVFSKTEDSYIGKLRSNHNKSKYLLFDNGGNVTKERGLDYNQVRCELGCIAYNIDHTEKGLRDITMAVPEYERDSQPSTIRPLKKEDSIAYKLGENDYSGLITFKSCKPYWSKEKKSYVLNFSDNIKKSSVKNFQLRLNNGEGITVTFYEYCVYL